MRGIITFVVMIAMLSIGVLIMTAVMDPLSTIALTYDLGGLSPQVNSIHETAVKYIWPVAIASILAWAVFWILRSERQTL